jgi:hypothetical protein
MKLKYIALLDARVDLKQNWLTERKMNINWLSFLDRRRLIHLMYIMHNALPSNDLEWPSEHRAKLEPQHGSKQHSLIRDEVQGLIC